MNFLDFDKKYLDFKIPLTKALCKKNFTYILFYFIYYSI